MGRPSPQIFGGTVPPVPLGSPPLAYLITYVNCLLKEAIQKRNLQTYKAPLESKAQGTSLFARAA